VTFRIGTALASLLLALPLAAPAALAAQGGTTPAPQRAYELRGTIVDTAGTPLPGASVALRLKGSTTAITGAVVGRDGSFRLIGLRPGTFSIRVTAIGFAPVIEDVTITDANPVRDLGTARLAPLAVAVSELQVTAEREVVTAEPDRNTYTAKALAPGAANASEVLENVPSVQVDDDGKVSLRGNENVVIQVNGRPTPMRGAQLASYLKTLSASVIDRIEVVPNPSAKHDPEGMAGIINIALKQNVDLGLSGAINTAVSTADRYNNAINIGYQSGPWTTFASAGLVADTRNAIGLNDRDRFDGANTLLSASSQEIAMTPSGKGQNFNLTVDYKVNARDVLSNALVVNRREGGEISTTSQSLFDGSGNVIDQFVRPRTVDQKGWMFDYDVAFKRQFTPRTHELAVELRFNRAYDEDSNDERRLAGGGYVDGRIDRNESVTKQLTAQLDYTRALRERTRLETGWKTTSRWLDRSFNVTTDSAGSGTYVPSPLGNEFGFDEAVHAGYVVLSQGAGKWDLQAGLRGEYADRNFTLASGSFPYSRTSFFPSGVAAYNFSPSAQAKVSYSRRIRRPGTQELNPFPVYFDADNVFLGNPQLDPEYTDALEASLMLSGSKGMVQLSPFYRRTSSVIRIDINTADTLDGREVTSITFQNLARANSWGTDLTGQWRVAPQFNVLTNFSVFKFVTDGGSSSLVGSDALGFTARVNMTLDVTRSFAVQGIYNYRAPMKIERGEMSAQQMANIVFRKKIQADRGTLLLRVSDPFEMIRFRVKTGDENLLQVTERNPESRWIFLGYQYNFGRPPKVRVVAPEQTGGGSVGFGG
jgi:ferric enterobactin receptor